MAAQPGNTVRQAPDGTIAEFAPDGRPVRLTLPDGSTYLSFDRAGRPVEGTIPEAGAVRLSYAADGVSTWSFRDGTRIVRSATGRVLQEVTPEGASFSRFDTEGRPVAGTLPDRGGGAPHDVTISYPASGGITWTFSDGTQQTREVAGSLVREALPDGSVFTSFDAQGRRTAGILPARDGTSGQSVTITYAADGGSVWTAQDGTRIERDAAGAPIPERRSDESVLTSLDGQGRPPAGTAPAHGATQPVPSSRHGYGTRGRTWSVRDGTNLVRTAAGTMVRADAPDGAIFTAFDAHGRPTAGSMPVHSGEPATLVRIGYQDDGVSAWSFADGTRLVRNAAGAVVREELPSGTVLTSFDGQSRPTAATVPGQNGQPAQSATISYVSDGGSVWSFTDGTRIRRDSGGAVVREDRPDGTVQATPDLEQGLFADVVPGQNGQPARPAGNTTRLLHSANGMLVEQRLPDGTVYTQFDAQQRPVAGVVTAGDGGPSRAVTIGYRDDGTGVWTYHDRSKVIANPGGAVVPAATTDGWSFDSFDSKGRPVVATRNGRSAKITYDGTGGSAWTFNDGIVCYRDSAGTLVRQTTPDGMELTSFDASGRPTGGTVPGASGTARRVVAIRYGGDGSSVWEITGGPTRYRDPGGTVVREVTPDGWTFTSFDSDGRPVAGANKGLTARIAYVGDNSVWTLGNGSIVTRHRSGITVKVEAADGAVFTSFDTANRPIAGTVPDKNGGPPLPVTIRYTSDGRSVRTVGDAEIPADIQGRTSGRG